MPKIAWILLLIKMFLIMPFGILTTTLFLYSTHQLNLTTITATEAVTFLLAGSGIVRILAGYVGGLGLSYRFLLCLCAITSIFSSLLLIQKQTFTWGVVLATVSSGLTIAVNCLITEIFEDDHTREKVFLYNYSGINCGYLLSAFISGYLELSQQYVWLFAFSILMALMALLLILIYYPLLELGNKQAISNKKYVLVSLLLCGIFLPFYIPLLKWLSIALCAIMSLFILYDARKTSDKKNQKNILTYFIFIVPVLIFWTIYHLTPIALTSFIENNVQRKLFHLTLAPQWFQIISTLAIILAGPLLARLFTYLRSHNIKITVLSQFTSALFLISLSLFSINFGIFVSSASELINPFWMILSFICQGIAEVLIAPIGFSLIGQLAPPHLRGIMMGNWMMLISIGAIFSGMISTHIFQQSGVHIINQIYQADFSVLAKLSLSTAILMMIVALCFKKINVRIISVSS